MLIVVYFYSETLIQISPGNSKQILLIYFIELTSSARMATQETGGLQQCSQLKTLHHKRNSELNMLIVSNVLQQSDYIFQRLEEREY